MGAPKRPARRSQVRLWAHLGSNQEQPGYEPGALTD